MNGSGGPAFDDDELEAYYRRIEAATAARQLPPRRNRRGGVYYEPPDCPTPEKIGYPSLAAVTGAILALTGPGRTSPRLRSYECRCGYWHLTSSVRG